MPGKKGIVTHSCPPGCVYGGRYTIVLSALYAARPTAHVSRAGKADRQFTPKSFADPGVSHWYRKDPPNGARLTGNEKPYPRQVARVHKNFKLLY